MSEPVGNSPRPIAGNSHKQRASVDRARADVETEADNRDKLDKVIDGDVTVQKRSWLKRFARGMLADDATSISDYILVDVLIPTFKATLRDIVLGVTDRSLYGSSGAGIINRGGPGFGLNGNVGGIKTKYSNIPEERPRALLSREARARHDFDEIVFPSREAAVIVLSAMYEHLERYRLVTVGDLYDLAGYSGDWAARNYGWSSLAAADIRQRGRGWVLELPMPSPIN